MSPPPFDALILCATPRSGSTLLLSLLAASGVAGRPEAWWRAENREEFADAWGLPRDEAGRWSPASYLRGAIAAGRSGNGVFGLRIMPPTRPELLAELATLFPGATTDADLLGRAFGRCRFVHLRRLDTVAQAVSRLRAEQSGLWHRIGAWEERVPGREGSPRYDETAIAAFRMEAEADNAAWSAWFEANGIDPLPVLYEDLARDPEGVASALLAALGLPDPGPLAFGNERLADAESAAWVARFRGRLTPPAPSGS